MILKSPPSKHSSWWHRNPHLGRKKHMFPTRCASKALVPLTASQRYWLQNKPNYLLRYLFFWSSTTTIPHTYMHIPPNLQPPKLQPKQNTGDFVPYSSTFSASSFCTPKSRPWMIMDQREAMSPMMTACQQDEDTVGRASRLSRPVSVRLTMRRTF